MSPAISKNDTSWLNLLYQAIPGSVCTYCCPEDFVNTFLYVYVEYKYTFNAVVTLTLYTVIYTNVYYVVSMISVNELLLK